VAIERHRPPKHDAIPIDARRVGFSRCRRAPVRTRFAVLRRALFAAIQSLIPTAAVEISPVFHCRWGEVSASSLPLPGLPSSPGADAGPLVDTRAASRGRGSLFPPTSGDLATAIDPTQPSAAVPSGSAAFFADEIGHHAPDARRHLGDLCEIGFVQFYVHLRLQYGLDVNQIAFCRASSERSDLNFILDFTVGSSSFLSTGTQLSGGTYSLLGTSIDACIPETNNCTTFGIYASPTDWCAPPPPPPAAQFLPRSTKTGGICSTEQGAKRFASTNDIWRRGLKASGGETMPSITHAATANMT
jgi:hypothetical protein